MDLKHNKNVQLVAFFANKGGGIINKMKMLKLVWLSDRLHLLTHGRPVSKDEYVAMEYGPVASMIKNIAEGKSNEFALSFVKPEGILNVVAVKEADKRYFSQTDLNVLETVWIEFGHIQEFGLSELSHFYPEWKKHEEFLIQNRSKKMSFEDFFLDLSPDTPFLEVFNLGKEKINIARNNFDTTENFKKTLEVLRNS